MRLVSLTVQGFRCFQELTTVEFDDLTAFVGVNGAGKSAVLMALARMFGVNSRLRTLTKEDFYFPADEEDPDELNLRIEARFEFPELLDDDDAESSAAVPECLRHIQVAGEKGDDPPCCRIALTATWSKTTAPEGDIDQRIEWFDSMEENPSEEATHRLGRVERSLVQVFYVPAARDAVRELRSASGTLLTRALRHVNWADATKDRIKALSEDIATELRSEEAFTKLESVLQARWDELGSTEGTVSLSSAEDNVASIMRRLDPRIEEAGSTRPVSLLSEGERSLLYFALFAAALEFEAAASHESDIVPVLTILAVEEPENHVAPQYLSRILNTLRAVESHREAQVVITSHSPAILRRVDPDEVRHFRGATHRTIRRLTLPVDAGEADKYVREAVRAYPEIYFARVCVLGEGASEQVVLPRLARALGVDVDPSFVSVVPLGGRHVNHFWTLLHDLGTPFVTLVDLDKGRAGGGCKRIASLFRHLMLHERTAKAVQEWAEDEYIEGIKGWDDDHEHIDEVIEFLEAECDVFLSAPLDLDLLMLSHYEAAYTVVEGTAKGPRAVPAKDPQRKKRLNRLTRIVLGEGGSGGSTYDDLTIEGFAWYSYLFLARSKPVTHALALSRLDDSAVQACPPMLERLVKRVRVLADG